MKFLYVIFGFVVLVLYASADLRGREFSQTKKGFVPQGVRGTHGGSRSFWYSGYHGGK